MRQIFRSLSSRNFGDSIFVGESPLRVSDISEFIKNNEEVIAANRAYDYIISWLARNDIRFGTSQYGEVWGVKTVDTVFVIDSVLSAALEDAGFSFDAVKKAWADNGWLITYKNKYKRRKGINGMSPYCVEILLPQIEEVEEMVEAKNR